jgi:hypothetical protein
MRIKYKGNATVRTIMQYRWDKANGYVCDVPEALAANLLTYPRPDFELAERNPQMATARIERSLSDKSKPRATRRRASGETAERPDRPRSLLHVRGPRDEGQG